MELLEPMMLPVILLLLQFSKLWITDTFSPVTPATLAQVAMIFMCSEMFLCWLILKSWKSEITDAAEFNGVPVYYLKIFYNPIWVWKEKSHNRLRLLIIKKLPFALWNYRKCTICY